MPAWWNYTLGGIIRWAKKNEGDFSGDKGKVLFTRPASLLAETNTLKKNPKKPKKNPKKPKKNPKKNKKLT
jgi:hypothetical protein